MPGRREPAAELHSGRAEREEAHPVNGQAPGDDARANANVGREVKSRGSIDTKDARKGKNRSLCLDSTLSVLYIDSQHCKFMWPNLLAFQLLFTSFLKIGAFRLSLLFVTFMARNIIHNKHLTLACDTFFSTGCL
jgi:hypothetical protein